MTKHEKLQEQYEDALFALLAEDAIQAHNEQASAVYERLEQSDENDIPLETDERMRAFIQAYRPPVRRFNKKRFVKAVSRVSVAACLAVAMTATAFAAFPALKVNAMNLYLEITEDHMDFHFSNGDATDYAESQPDSNISKEDDFVISWLPAGFILEQKTVMDDFIIEYKYKSDHLPEDEAFIVVSKIFGDGTTTTIDTEDSEVKDVKVGNIDAIFTRKNAFHDISLTWQIEDENALMRIVALGISEQDLMKIAEGIHLN